MKSQIKMGYEMPRICVEMMQDYVICDSANGTIEDFTEGTTYEW